MNIQTQSYKYTDREKAIYKPSQIQTHTKTQKHSGKKNKHTNIYTNIIIDTKPYTRTHIYTQTQTHLNTQTEIEI